MKKILAMLLALAMVFALCACGQTEEAAEEPAAEVAEEPVAEVEEAEDVVEEGAEIEPLDITFNCTYAETEIGGELAQYFADQCEELSGGAITVNISFGETLFTSADQLDAVGTGAVEMCELGHSNHSDVLPLLCSFPDYAPDSIQNALDYFNYLLFDNAETSAILTAEAEAAGVKYLNVTAGGANAFVAKYEFDSLDSLIEGSTAFGNMLGDKYIKLGIANVVAVFPWDYYSSFDTGLMDSTQMGSSAMFSMGVQEVAQYWMYDNTYTAGNFFTVNLDWWNGLSAEQQAVLQQAADAVEAYSVECYTDALATEASDLEAAGCTLIEMTDEEFDRWWSAILTSNESEALANGETNGNVEDVEVILAAVEEFTAGGAVAAEGASGEMSGEPSGEPLDESGTYTVEIDGEETEVGLEFAELTDTSKSFTISYGDTVVTGVLEKGVWTADNDADQELVEAVQAAYQGYTGAGVATGE